MNRCPPNPGSTDYEQDRRQLEIGLGGVKRRGRVEHQAEPEIEPSRLLSYPGRVGHHLDVDGDQVRSSSGELLQMSLRVGDHEMRSRRRAGRSCSDAITGIPRDRLGTKCPSITSMWSRSTTGSTSATVSPSLLKSAARIDGAILTMV